MQVSVLGGKHIKAWKAEHMLEQLSLCLLARRFHAWSFYSVRLLPSTQRAAECHRRGEHPIHAQGIIHTSRAVVKKMCILTVISLLTRLSVGIVSIIYGGHSLGICYFETNCLVFSAGLSRYVNSENGLGCGGVFICYLLFRRGELVHNWLLALCRYK